MAAGEERQALLRVADGLSATLGGLQAKETLCVQDLGLEGSGSGDLADLLSPQDEKLVLSLRGSLARIAAAAGGATVEQARVGAVRAALEGAELVMRGALVAGNGAQVASLIPSFVYLVTLPTVGQDEAITLSRRASVLVAAEFG